MNIEIEERRSLDCEELNLAQTFSDKYGLSSIVSKIIVARDIKSDEDLKEFLYLDKSSFSDPYLLSGMKEVVERLKLAKENQEKVVVYGDYDADGICAAYILVNALREYGVEDVEPYIPNRTDGYGLNFTAIESIAEEYQPDLVLTCDLGISCKEEVQYFFDLGIDVLVSDHHELPKELPNCPCINPKLDEGRYPFIDLCGAGVAFKIAQALLTDKYMQYIEFAAIATVADSVTLIKENRAIVKLGLKKMNENPDKSLKILVDSCGIKGEITSSTVAFIIAPRINASGRMGIAKRSLNMFMSNDEEGTKAMVDEINLDNSQRQKTCETIFKEGYSVFAKDGKDYACILKNEKWQTGLLGIVASKLTEEFNRPTILFSCFEENLRGSGRSIDGINMFEMLSSMSDLFITFGGHAQACGLTIHKSKFEEFKNRCEEYLRNISIEKFIPTVKYDVDEKECKIDINVIEKLSILEPFGVGNPKPYFLKTQNNIMMEEMKNYPNHLIGKGEFSSLRAFSFGKYLEVLRSDVKKNLLLDYSITKIGGKKYLQSNIKEFYTKIEKDNLNKDKLLFDYLFNIDFEYYQPITKDQYLDIIKSAPFGSLSIASTSVGLDKLYKLNDGTVYIDEGNAIVVKSNINKILLAPKTAVNFDKYSNIFIMENYLNLPFDRLPQGRNYYTLSDLSFLDDLKEYSNRDCFAKCYMAIKTLENIQCLGYNNIIIPLGKLGIEPKLAMIAFAIFKELNLLRIENGKLLIEKNKKVELSDSKLFSYLQK